MLSHTLPPPITLDGRLLPFEEPADRAALCGRVREAAANGEAIFPVGAGLGQDYGGSPRGHGVALGMTKLNRVIDFPARDMTLTVEAGITLAEIETLAKAENLRLPIDPPGDGRATIGGAIAVNAAGPRRLGWGTLRDYVLGCTVINANGEACKSGGRVVKNVAGYDLHKLHIGALGTLGVVAEVTLKLVPRPEAGGFFVATLPEQVIGLVLDRLNASRTRPVAIELSNEPVARRWRLAVGYEDNAASVKWQLDQVRDELAPLQLDDVSQIVDDATVSLWSRLANAADMPGCEHVLRIHTRPSQVPESVALVYEQRIHVHAGSGIVIVGCRGEDELQHARSELNFTQQPDATIVRRAPAAAKAKLGMWGQPRADRIMMARVRHALDPAGRFNPGRFFDEEPAR